MIARPKIVFADDVHESMLEIFREELPDGFDLEILERDTPEEKARLVESADYVLVWAGDIPTESLANAERLKLIQKCGQGLDNLPVEVARGLGIPIANAGGTNSTAVAEMAILLLQVRATQPLPRDRGQDGGHRRSRDDRQKGGAATQRV
jgi:D-3-phosphoglycerate dehydrogenase